MMPVCEGRIEPCQNDCRAGAEGLMMEESRTAE